MRFASFFTTVTLATGALAGTIVPKASAAAPTDIIDRIQLHARLAMATYSNPVSPTEQMNATKEVSIVLRDILSLRNGQTSADSMPNPVSWSGCIGCTVHHEFYTNYLDAKNYTNSFATAFNATSSPWEYKVNCVGHPLGVAVAPICGGDLFPSGKVSAVYTYGEFRTMNQVAVTWVDSHLGTNIYRVVNGRGSVPTPSDTDPDCAGESSLLDHNPTLVHSVRATIIRSVSVD